jgi:hypothetical protein
MEPPSCGLFFLAISLPDKFAGNLMVPQGGGFI